jgi:hypothetical protein
MHSATSRFRASLLSGCMVLGTVLMLAPSAHAGQVTLDFEQFVDLDSITTQVPGFTFANAIVFTTTGTLNGGDYPAHSGVALAVDNGGPISIVFNLPGLGAAQVTAVRGFFTYATPVSFEALGAGGASLGIATSAFSTNSLSSGNPPSELLEIVAPDIRGLKITGDPGGFSVTLDDLTLTFDPAAVTVPEPATWVFAVLGVAAMGTRRLLTRARRS